MNKLFECLNNKQKEAVITDKNVVTVMAGAGSGKTRVLTNRIAYLVNDNLTLEEEILAITFTNKASLEMENRLKGLGINTNKIWVMTFHVFCVKILRKWIHKIGYINNFSIIDPQDQKKILKEIYIELNLDSSVFPYNKILRIISNNKTSLVDLELDEKDNLNKILCSYDKYLKKNNLLDFDDLLVKALIILQKFPEIAEIYKRKFKHILIDEFQDTNLLQLKIIKNLYSNNNNLYIVGDPDQSIYKFRGSIEGIFNNFVKEFGNVYNIILDQNYRSTSSILHHANLLIEKNTNRVKKKLFTEKKSYHIPSIIRAYNYKEASESIAKEILNIVNKKNNFYEKIAILYRNNYLSKTIEEALIKNKIPYKLIGNKRFWDRKEIKDILSYFYFIINKNNDFYLKRIINEPKRGIGKKTLKNIEEEAIKKNIFLFDSLKLSKKSSIRLFIEFIDEISFKIENNIYDSPSDFFEEIYSKSGYEESLKNNNEELRIQNILELKQDFINFFNENNEEKFITNLNNYLQKVSLSMEANEENKNSVSLMTVHSSKGLEFDIVFIFGVNQGEFPSKRSIENNELEEERRLMYVAITRAKEKLYISYSCKDNFNNNIFPSDFLYESEILKYNISSIDNTTSSNTDNKINLNNTIFNVGDKVSHNKYGEGYVLKINDKFLDVYFFKYNKKTIISDYLCKISGV